VNKSNFFFIKVVSDLKFGHFYFSWPPLTSATSEVRWKTSNFIVDFDVEKREDFGVLLSESINFDYLRP
jgi:hypothetical protein